MTGIDALERIEQDIAWEWQHSMSGSTYRPGETYRETPLISDRVFWVHAMDADADPSTAQTKEQILRLVVEDFGVRASTSTANGLSAGDRSALKGICEAQDLPGDTEPDEKPAGDTKGDRENSANDEAAAADGTSLPLAGISPPGGGAGLWVLLLLLVPFFAYALRGEKVLAPFKRDRGQRRAVEPE